jgi:hypothetical protein
MSKEPFNAKKATNDVLEHIIKFYPIDAKRTRKIEKYLLKEELQNENGMDKYIEMVLTEKANNK